MAERLTGILTELKTLMEGKRSGLDRPIPAGRFVHKDFPIEQTLEAGEKPYPFNVDTDDGGSEEGFFEAAYNTAGNHHYHMEQVRLRVGYTGRPTENFLRDQTIREDRRAIVRCLGFSDSWSSATGFVRVADMDHRIVPTATMEEEPGLMLVLEITFKLYYREDMTS
jgi:hypothetical protein